MGLKKYFWDSYAVMEFIHGNPSYLKFSKEPVFITVFNLVEIFWGTLNQYGEEKAEEIYKRCKNNVLKISDEVLKKAVKFRKKVYKDRKVSYADAIGYVFALENGMIFLTGDKEFKDLENVEGVK